MAAGPIVIFDKALLNMLSSTSLLSASSFAVSLHTGAWTPSMSGNELFADVGNEIAAGNGYAAGGKVLTGVVLGLMNGAVRFTCDPVKWDAAGGSIPAWRYGVVHAIGTYNGKVNPLLGYFIGEIGNDPANPAPVDIAATTSGNSVVITPHADGLISASRGAS